MIIIIVLVIKYSINFTDIFAGIAFDHYFLRYWYKRIRGSIAEDSDPRTYRFSL